MVVLPVVLAGFLLACSLCSVSTVPTAPTSPITNQQSTPVALTSSPVLDVTPTKVVTTQVLPLTSSPSSGGVTLRSVVTDVLHRHGGEAWSSVATQSTKGLAVGDGVNVDVQGRALLTVASNVSLEVFRNSELERLDNWVKDAPTLKLRQGFLRVSSGEVSDKLLRLVDDYYEIRDVGTEYWLYHDSAAGVTWVIVTKGRVQLVPLKSQGDSVDVPAGFQAVGVKGAQPIGPFPATRPSAELVGLFLGGAGSALPTGELLTNEYIVDTDLLRRQQGCSGLRSPLELHISPDAASQLADTLSADDLFDVIGRGSAKDGNWVQVFLLRKVEGVDLQVKSGWVPESSVACTAYDISTLAVSPQTVQSSPTAGQFTVVIAAVRVTPNQGDSSYGYSNACLQEFEFSGTIRSTGVGRVKYWWQRVSDGFQVGSGEHEFREGGNKDVSAYWSPSPRTEEEWEFHIISSDGRGDQRRFIIVLDCPAPTQPTSAPVTKAPVPPQPTSAPVTKAPVPPQPTSAPVTKAPVPPTRTPPPQGTLLEAPSITMDPPNLRSSVSEARKAPVRCAQAETQLFVRWKALAGATSYKVELREWSTTLSVWRVVSSGTWSFWKSAEIDVSTQVNGNRDYQLTVSARDAQGQSGKSASWYFHVDERLD